MENNYLLFKKNNILSWIFIPVLYFLSLIYNFLITVIKFLHKNNILPAHRPKLKAISVGNITLGGSGKTPLVEWITEYLRKQNKKVGIIIRGYKRPHSNYKGIIKNDSSYFDTGDEASMLKEEFKDIKISVGRDKVYSARLLEKENCDVAILDDGFQHWRLKRDLDIVAIDASSPLTKQRLMPLGRLREPLNSLKRADILFLTKIDMSRENYLKNKEILHKINPRALVVSSVYEPVCFCSLKTGDCVKPGLNKSALILCGIANPLYFENMVSKLQLNIKKKLIYPDHYGYKKEDLNFIKKSAKDGSINTIVTTHKDAVRLKPFMDIFDNIDILYLKIKLKIQENEEALHNRLLSVFDN